MLTALLNEYKNSLENAYKCNKRIKSEILDNSNLCYNLSLPKEQIRANLVNKKDVGDIMDDIKLDLKKLQFFKEETVEITKSIFDKIHDENLLHITVKANNDEDTIKKVNINLTLAIS
jgi:hypothetical protein